MINQENLAEPLAVVPRTVINMALSYCGSERTPLFENPSVWATCF